MFNKILNIFKESELEIKDIEKLKQYINYCIGNAKNKIKGETSHHHILPSKLFPEYSDLKTNIWNGSNLSFYDHYYAHWLLCESVNNSSMIYAFVAMHNKDSKNNRISEGELFSKEELTSIMANRSRLIGLNNTKRNKEGTLFGGHIFDRKKSCEKTKQTLKDNPEIKINANKKHIATKSSKEWKETIGEKQSEKQSKTKSSKEWKETIEKDRIIKFKELFAKNFNREKHLECSLKMAKFKNFEIFDKNNDLIFKYSGSLSEFCKCNNLPYTALKKSSSENRLYSKTAGLRNAKKFGYEKYEGYYLKLL